MTSCARARWAQYVADVQQAFIESVVEVKAVCLPGELRPYPDDQGCRVGLEILDNVLINAMLVDKVVNGKDDKYAEFCMEKSRRTLEKHVERGDISSFQSWNEKEKKYPGAIIAFDSHGRPHAYTCSGYAWKIDEAISLLTAYKVGNLTKAQAIAIANISSNEIFMRVAAKLPDPEPQAA